MCLICKYIFGIPLHFMHTIFESRFILCNLGKKEKVYIAIAAISVLYMWRVLYVVLIGFFLFHILLKKILLPDANTMDNSICRCYVLL